MPASFKLVNKDIFESSDEILVIPRNTKGGISPEFARGLKSIKSNYQPDMAPSKLGQLSSVNPPSGTKDEASPSFTLLLATTVDEGATQPDTIFYLGKKLAGHNRGAKVTIACPLLGSGSGMIAAKVAFIKLIKGLQSVKRSAVELIVYIPERRVYEELTRIDLEGFDSNGNYIYPRNPHGQDMYADRPIDNEVDDELDFSTFANALAGVIDNEETKTPLTLVVNAPWGAGKSSLGKLIQSKLKEWPAELLVNHRTVWFNAWSHDEADHLKSAFTAFVIREIDQYRSYWNRWMRPVPIHLSSDGDRFLKRQRGLINAILVALILYIPYFLLGGAAFDEIVKVIGLPVAENSDLVGGVTVAGAGLGGSYLFRYLFQTASALKNFVARPKSEAQTGKIFKVRQDIHAIIDEAVPDGTRLVIFVDDLERCRNTGPVDLLEAINQLLDHPKVVIVILADILAVAAAADIKYDEVASRYNPGNIKSNQDKKTLSSDYGRLYIQKIIQLQFDLPIFSNERMNELVNGIDEKKKSREKKAEIQTSKKPGKSSITANFKRLIELLMLGDVRGTIRHWRVKKINLWLVPFTIPFWLLLAPVFGINSLIEFLIYRRWQGGQELLSNGYGLWKGVIMAMNLIFMLGSAIYYIPAFENLAIEVEYRTKEQSQITPYFSISEIYVRDTAGLKAGWDIFGDWQYTSGSPVLISGRNESINRPISFEEFSSLVFTRDLNQSYFPLTTRGSKVVEKSGQQTPGYIKYQLRPEAWIEALKGGDEWDKARYRAFNKFRKALISDFDAIAGASALVRKSEDLTFLFLSLPDSLSNTSVEYRNAYRRMRLAWEEINTSAGTDSISLNSIEKLDSIYAFRENLLFQDMDRLFKKTTLTNETTLYLSFLVFMTLVLLISRLNIYAVYTKTLLKTKEEIRQEMEINNYVPPELSNRGIQSQEFDDIVRKVAYERITGEGKKFDQARSAAIGYLKTILPRNAKRLSNKLRLLLNIAYERKIIDEIEPKYFGKWVALQEAFPEFATYISRNMDEMCFFEKKASEILNSRNVPNSNLWSEINDKLKKVNTSYQSKTDLLELIAGDDVLLSKWIYPLVYYQKRPQNT